MKFLSFDWFVAKRYLQSPKKEGFISVIAGFSFLGIALGVATLIIVMSVMNGFREELLKRIIGMKGHAVVYGKNSIPENKIIKELISSEPNVIDILPIVEGQGVLFFNSKAQGIIIKGVNGSDLKRQKMIAQTLSSDNFKNFENNAIFIGRRLSERFQIKIGDSLSILTPTTQATAFGTFPKQRRFKVCGIFEVGMHEFDKSVAFIPDKAAQRLFNMEGRWSLIEIFVQHPELTSVMVKNLSDILNKQTFAQHPTYFEVLDWQHSDAHIFHAVQVERNVMFLILTLIILIASFNVVSGLIMLVKDKTRDIAILKTIGASNGSIMRIFFITGSSIGIVGTGFGLTLGLLFVSNIETIRRFLESLLQTELFQSEIYFLSKLPFKVDYSEIMWITIMSLLLSFLATLYPSFKASKLNPIEGLHG